MKCTVARANRVPQVVPGVLPGDSVDPEGQWGDAMYLPEQLHHIDTP